MLIEYSYRVLNTTKARSLFGVAALLFVFGCIASAQIGLTTIERPDAKGETPDTHHDDKADAKHTGYTDPAGDKKQKAAKEKEHNGQHKAHHTTDQAKRNAENSEEKLAHRSRGQKGQGIRFFFGFFEVAARRFHKFIGDAVGVDLGAA